MSWIVVFLLAVALIEQRGRFRQQAQHFWAAMEVVITRMNRIYVMHERLYGGEDIKGDELVEGFMEFNDSLMNLRKALVEMR